MKLHRILAVTALSVASLGLVACSNAPSTVVGTWGDPEAQGEPSLVFEEDGNLHGSDGCNNLMGTYEAQGTEVSFPGLASTLMFCEGVDDWLLQGHNASVEGDTLTVFNEAGEEIGQLTRNA